MSKGHRSVSPMHDVDRRERHVQLLGRELRERRHGALPHLHLAQEHRHAPVRADVDERVEVRARPLDPRGIPDRAEHALRRREREDHEQPRARELQEVAAVDRVDESPALGNDHLIVALAHFPPPDVAACDAASIASMIPAWAPHRHRCAFHPLHDFLTRRLGVGREQRGPAHDHAGRAIAALEAEMVDEALLHGRQAGRPSRAPRSS